MFLKNRYIVEYLVQCGWGVMCEEYKCTAYTKKGAFKKFVKGTAGDVRHYTDRSKMTYECFKNDIYKY